MKEMFMPYEKNKHIIQVTLNMLLIIFDRLKIANVIKITRIKMKCRNNIFRHTK